MSTINFSILGLAVLLLVFGAGALILLIDALKHTAEPVTNQDSMDDDLVVARLEQVIDRLGQSVQHHVNSLGRDLKVCQEQLSEYREQAGRGNVVSCYVDRVKKGEATVAQLLKEIQVANDAVQAFHWSQAA